MAYEDIVLSREPERVFVENEAWPENVLLSFDLFRDIKQSRMSISNGRITFRVNNGSAEYLVTGFDPDRQVFYLVLDESTAYLTPRDNHERTHGDV